MKTILTSLILCFSLSVCSEEHSFLEQFPKYTSENLIEFCEQGIKYSDFMQISLFSNQDSYHYGYWCGQRDAYNYMLEKL